VDIDGNVSGDGKWNLNGSTEAIEGLFSPDGRVFGKMGHTERHREGLYKNVSGAMDMGIFRAGVNYFK
jgi:phosphoribosylformylglycinamidine synthase